MDELDATCTIQISGLAKCLGAGYYKDRDIINIVTAPQSTPKMPKPVTV